MNSYLSRAEKATFIQLSLLAGLERKCIQIYSEGNNADRDFLKKLRTSHTWLIKAIEYRESFLDVEAAKDLANQVTKLEFIFVPSDKAKKEYELLKEVKSNIHMPIEDFEDWYSEVLEHTCKTCIREDYKNCAIRRIMVKHGVLAINPAAKDTCQYSYVDADPDELPQYRQPREIEDVEDVSEIAEIETAEAKCESSDTQVPRIDLAGQEETLPSESEKSESALVQVEIYFASGVRLELGLPRHMATQLLMGMQSMPKHNRPVCACHVGDELVAIDTQEVAVFRATGIGECELEQLPRDKLNGNMNALPHRSALMGNQKAQPKVIEAAAFKIECKCGAEYVCKLGADRNKARCQKCHSSVYLDKDIKEPIEDGGDAMLMTNRYFVPMDGPVDQKDKAPAYKQRVAGSYQDPCRIFE